MNIVGAGLVPARTCHGGVRNRRRRSPGRHKAGPYVVLSIFLLGLSPLFASPSQLKEGNRQFKNKNYDKALQLYEDALIDTPYSSILHFNAGDAQAMMGDLSKADASFIDAGQSANPILKGASRYNRGNLLFAQGKWADAVEAYKDSLRANPQDEDAKYNLGIALRALHNPPPPKQGQGKQDQKQGGGSNDQKQQQAKPDQMSKEDAERLLDAAGAGEKKKSNQKMPKNEAAHPDEDW